MRFKTIFDTYEEKQGIIFKEPTMTVQSEKDNCDINVIMNRMLLAALRCLIVLTEYNRYMLMFRSLAIILKIFSVANKPRKCLIICPAHLEKSLTITRLICYPLFKMKRIKRGVTNMDYLISQLWKLLKLLLLLILIPLILFLVMRPVLSYIQIVMLNR